MPLPPALRSLLRHTPSLAPVPHRAVLSVTGSQASEFLQGVLSASVTSPPKPGYSALLHAQGRVLHDVLLYTQKDAKGQPGYLIEYDPRPSEAPPLLELLKRYVLRAKVRIRDASEEYSVWSAWGSDTQNTRDAPREWSWAKSGVVEPAWGRNVDWPWGKDDHSMVDQRAFGMGARLLSSKGDKPRGFDNYDVISEDDYTLHRILHGVPEGSDDIIPMHAFPMEANMDMMGGVDFRKGCYVGQELTVRTYHTGLIRKRIVPVSIRASGSSELLPSTGAESLSKDAKIYLASAAGSETSRARSVGKLLTRTNGLGLALLRLDHCNDAICGTAKLQVETQSGVVQVEPWRPEWWPEEPIVDDSV